MSATWLTGWDYRILMIPQWNALTSSYASEESYALTPYGTAFTIKLSDSTGINNVDLTNIFDVLGSNYLKMTAIVPRDGMTHELSTFCHIDIEKWDVTNKEAVLHIRGVGETDMQNKIYLYFDAAQTDNSTYVHSTISGGAADDVWTAENLVNHMNCDPAGGSNAMKDVSGEGNHGTASGGMGSANLVDTDFGKGIELDGINDLVEILTYALGEGAVFARYKLSTDNTTKNLLKRSDDDDMFHFYVDIADNATPPHTCSRLLHCLEYGTYDDLGEIQVPIDAHPPDYGEYSRQRDEYVSAAFFTRGDGSNKKYYFAYEDEHIVKNLVYGSSYADSLANDATWQIGAGTADSNNFKGILSEIRFFNPAFHPNHKQWQAFNDGYANTLLMYAAPCKEGQYVAGAPAPLEIIFNQPEFLGYLDISSQISLEFIQKVISTHQYTPAPIQRADAIFTQNDTNIAQIFIHETIPFLLLLKASTLFFIIESGFTSLLFNTEQIALPFHGTITDLKTSATKGQINCTGSKGYIDITGFSSKIIT